MPKNLRNPDQSALETNSASGLTAVMIEAAILRGDLKAIQIGDQTLIFANELEDWLAKLFKSDADRVNSRSPSPVAAEKLEHLVTRDAAAYLNLAPSTLERHRCRGTGPRFVRLGNGRSIRYRRPDLDEWCHARQSTSEPDSSGRKSDPRVKP